MRGRTTSRPSIPRRSSTGCCPPDRPRARRPPRRSGRGRLPGARRNTTFTCGAVLSRRRNARGPTWKQRPATVVPDQPPTAGEGEAISMPFVLDSGNTAWMLTASALVLLMTPGLAFFYGGMVRGKSVLNMMMMSFGAMGVVGVIWMLYGYSGAFGHNVLGGLVGNPLQYFGVHTITAKQSLMAAAGVPALVGVVFQASFAIITAALISGAVADRMKFSAWMVFAGIWATLVYIPMAHMVWGGGLLGPDGITSGISTPIDFAGGTVVHINAGMAGLVLAIILGKRKGFNKDPMRPHNLPFVMLGAALLWFGWFGYDDSLDVVGVHLVGGLTGTILIGFFAHVGDGVNGTWYLDGSKNGLLYGGGANQLVTQIIVALFAVVFSGVMTTIIAFAIKAAMGLRTTEEVEVGGIDLAVHGETAYESLGGARVTQEVKA